MNSHGSGLLGSTSTTLVERARQRDPRAWAQLVELYAPLVYHWCRRGSVQPADAADLVQEVFHSVLLGLPGYRHDPACGSFRGWLRVISSRRLADRGRREAAEAIVSGEDLANQVSRNETQSESAPGAALPVRVHAALEAVRADVEESTWNAFWRTTVDGVPPAEVAQELGLRPDSVYQVRSRILHKLRRLLVDDGPS